MSESKINHCSFCGNHKDAVKKLSLDFLDTKHVEELSQLGDLLKIFRKNCHMINSTNDKIDDYEYKQPNILDRLYNFF